MANPTIQERAEQIIVETKKSAVTEGMETLADINAYSVCWLITVLLALFIGALISDVLFPWIRERRQIKRLEKMKGLPAFLRRQAD